MFEAKKRRHRNCKAKQRQACQTERRQINYLRISIILTIILCENPTNDDNFEYEPHRHFRLQINFCAGRNSMNYIPRWKCCVAKKGPKRNEQKPHKKNEQRNDETSRAEKMKKEKRKIVAWKIILGLQRSYLFVDQPTQTISLLSRAHTNSIT